MGYFVVRVFKQFHQAEPAFVDVIFKEYAKNKIKHICDLPLSE